MWYNVGGRGLEAIVADFDVHDVGGSNAGMVFFGSSFVEGVTWHIAGHVGGQGHG